MSGKIGDVVSLYVRCNSPITGPRHYKGATDLSMHVMVHDIDATGCYVVSGLVDIHTYGAVGFDFCG